MSSKQGGYLIGYLHFREKKNTSCMQIIKPESESSSVDNIRIVNISRRENLITWFQMSPLWH